MNDDLFTRSWNTIKIFQVKYLNNILEQDHRFIKRITRPMLGFKALHSTDATLAGIETAHMIRKGQLDAIGSPHSTSLGRSHHNCVRTSAAFNRQKNLRQSPRNDGLKNHIWRPSQVGVVKLAMPLEGHCQVV